MKAGAPTQQTRVFSPAALKGDGPAVVPIVRTYLMNVPGQDYNSAPGVTVANDQRKVTIRTKKVDVATKQAVDLLEKVSSEFAGDELSFEQVK